MEDKRMKKTLERKEEIEGEIKAIIFEINLLKKTKDDCKINTNELDKKEQQKKKMVELKKELSTVIKTIKCCKTKIENKIKLIDKLNSDIKEINEEINETESEKINKLLDLERKNMSKLNNLRKKDKSLEEIKKLYKNDDKKIELIEAQIKEAIAELNCLEEKIASEFQEICKKYDANKKEKKDLIKKYVLELQKANKSIETFKSTIEKSFIKIEEILKEAPVNDEIVEENGEEIKENKIISENETEEFVQIIEPIDINKNEEKKIAQKKSEQEADVVVNEFYMDKIKEIIESEEQEKQVKQFEITESEKENVKIERTAVYENLKENIVDETKSSKKEKLNEVIEKEESEGESNILEFEENDEIDEQSEDYISMDFQLGGPMYKQAYANMIRRNGSMNSFKFDDEETCESDNKSSECINTLVYDWFEEKAIKKMLVKESNDVGDSENKYIEIDGKKYQHNRTLDEKTREDLDSLCKEYLKIRNKMTLKDKIRLKMLKAKIDPAIINAIKYRLKDKYKESESDILKSYNDSKTPIEINYMIENAKRNYKYEYANLITKYIQCLEEKDIEKLSFYLYYDCSENLKSTKYMEIYPYISNAEKAGVTVIDMQTPMEIIKGLFQSNETCKDLKKSKYLEGDKSFIPKISILSPSPVPVKVYSENNKRIRINENRNPNNYNGYRH